MRAWTRREVLERLGWGSLAIPIALLGLSTYRFFDPTTSPGVRVAKIGPPEDFPPGTRRFIPELRLTITSIPSGLFAMSLICTHLGCTVNTMEWGYQCPCHGSRFDNKGLVLRGPAPRPLPWFKLYQAPDGLLVVDTTRAVPRGTFYRPL